MALLSAITITFASLFCPEEPNKDSVDAMIKKLGSPRFEDRERAKKWLLARPEQAEKALRGALRSADLEMAARATWILKEFDKRPLREIQAAVKEKAVERAVAMLAGFPERKDEGGAWSAARELAITLLELHKKKGGHHINILFLAKEDRPPVVQTGPRTTIPPITTRESALFFRSGEVVVDKNSRLLDCLIITSGGLQIRHLWRSVVFAAGPVKLERSVMAAIIVSFGDVTVEDLGGSLVIAKGKVTCTGYITHSRIISGKSVTYRRASATNCIITENEASPLGLTNFFDRSPANLGKKAKSSKSGN